MTKIAHAWHSSLVSLSIVLSLAEIVILPAITINAIAIAILLI
jgi:hypothetical protein